MATPPVMSVKGYRGTVEFDGMFVTIKHSGFAPGGRSDRRFTLAQISGVEVKKAGLTSGAFTLVVAGAIAPQGGLMARRFDPLTVEFTWGKQRDFEALRDAVLQALHRHYAPQPAEVAGRPVPSLAGDLAALADLRDRGVLTPIEFQTVTGRLLGHQQR